LGETKHAFGATHCHGEFADLLWPASSARPAAENK
jgi:hypothetical protein